MELKIYVEFGMQRELADLFISFAKAVADGPVKVSTPAPVPTEAPERPEAPAAAQPEEKKAPTVAEFTEQNVAIAKQRAAEPPKEKPEDVLPILRQRFGIPDNKEDRDEDQTRRAKALTKAVRELLRDITKDRDARSTSDLKDDVQRVEFVRSALLITYDVTTETFDIKPF